MEVKSKKTNRYILCFLGILFIIITGCGYSAKNGDDCNNTKKNELDSIKENEMDSTIYELSEKTTDTILLTRR